MSEHPSVALAIVSPVRNESKYLRLTLDSMVAQTLGPSAWAQERRCPYFRLFCFSKSLSWGG